MIEKKGFLLKIKKRNKLYANWISKERKKTSWQVGEMSGIGRRVYPHLIRHTTATDGLFRGMPVEEVQKLLGHVNITTTMIYAEVSEENTKNDHKKYIV